MSEWLFDLGNSRLKVAPLQADGSLGEVHALAHDGTAFAAGWQHTLPSGIDAAHVASVAPGALRTALLDALAGRAGRIGIATTQRSWQGLRIAYPQPARLGVDRFLALLGARERPGHWLVVGVGTALTLDLLDARGQHRGGRIAPSPTLMREALHARAAQLPLSGGAYRVFADDTDDALQSGCVGAALALVERSRDEARHLCEGPVSLLLHGGGASALLPLLGEAVCDPALVLRGLSRWARIDAPPR